MKQSSLENYVAYQLWHKNIRDTQSLKESMQMAILLMGATLEGVDKILHEKWHEWEATV